MGTYVPPLPVQNFVPTKTVVRASWLNAIDNILQGNVPANGVYNGTFGSGQIQLTGPNGYMTSYGDLGFSLASPGPIGVGPFLRVVGAGKIFGQIGTDAQVPNQNGINLSLSAGDVAAGSSALYTGGNLLLIGGGGALGSGGTATLQGGTSANGPGGNTFVQGGNATAGVAGNLYLSGGLNGPLGGGSVHLIMTNTAGGVGIGSIVFRVNSTVLWTINSSGALFLGATGAGTPGQVLISNGPNALPSWVAGSSGQLLYPQTQAEINGGVTPINFNYAEGDIRRYGAGPALADNSAAIQQALDTCAWGGAAVFIPPGAYNITSSLIVRSPVGAIFAPSMYGMGKTSQISPQTCDGLVFQGQPFVRGPRFFRDFQIVGTNTGSNSAIAADPSMTAATGKLITDVAFINLGIQNFGQAVKARQFWNCTFRDCSLYNNYQGYFFHGQNIQCSVERGFCQQGAIAGVGQAFGVLADVVDGESTQSLHLLNTNIYQFDYSVSVGPALYTVIDNCDLSTPKVAGVNVAATAGGLTIKGCWIQPHSPTAAQTFGILLADLGSPVQDKIVIDSCTIFCDVANAASNGIYVGTNQKGVTIENCTIGASSTPFAFGIVTNGLSDNTTIRDNNIYATNTAILLSSNASNVTVGPNAVQSGVPLAFSGVQPTGFILLSKGMSGTAGFGGGASVAVVLSTAMPSATYKVSLGGNPSGFVWVTGKTANGFTINCSVANNNSTDWAISPFIS